MHLDGLSYQEMAAVVGISENHVGVKLTRIRQQLARSLQGDSMTFEEIQSQWQAQPAPEILTDSAQLQAVQEQQRKFQSAIFWRDFREVGVAFAMAAVMVRSDCGVWIGSCC